MKLVGLLCWFDENPVWLRQAASSALELCDEVVALDGAYDGFPGAAATSPAEQVAALWEAGAVVVQPGFIWRDQMGKRTALFEYGRKQDADWFLVFDADDVVASIPFDARRRLEATAEDVAVFTYGNDRYHRGLFRSLPNLRVEDAHYHYVADKDGATVHLRGNEQVHDLCGFENLTNLRVVHRKAEDLARTERALEYRRLVAERQIEPTTPEQWMAVA